MSTKRITVSVPSDIAAQIKRAAGGSRSVSEWVTSAVKRSLEDEELERRFLELCDSVPATAEEERRARASFEQIVAPKKVTKKTERRGGKSAA